MHMPSEQTIYDSILESDVLNMREQSLSVLKNSMHGHFYKGNVLIKIPINLSDIQTILDTRQNPISAEEENSRTYNLLPASGLWDSVTKKVINITTGTNLKQSLDIIMKLRDSLVDEEGNKTFYGAIIRDQSDPDTIINPFHVLSALSLLEEGNDDRLYDIIVYYHSNYNSAMSAYALEDVNLDNFNHMDRNIDAILKLYVSKLPTVLKKVDSNTDNNPSTNTHNLTLSYQVRKFPGEEQDREHYVVSHQILSNGIFIPYYGTSLIEVKDLRSSGLSLSQMNSCNIITNQHHNRSNDYFGICTGNVPKYTEEGLRTLTHANLSSPFTRNIMAEGSLIYANKMIDRSIELYKVSGLIEKSTEEKYTQEELNADSWVELANLLSSKTHLTIGDIQERFKEIKTYRGDINDQAED